MNIKMQCCGILILLVIFFFYFRQKKINLNTERAFRRMGLSILVSLILDILSLVGLYYVEELPEIVTTIICKAYISSLVLVTFFSLLYLCVDIYNQSGRLRKTTYGFVAFAGLGILLIWILPIYKYTEDPNNMYTYGPSTLATYFFCLVQIITILYLTIRRRSSMSEKRREAVQIWVVLWILAAGTQFLYNKLLIVGFASAVGVMIIYLKLENPEANRDRRTGLFNKQALIQYMTEKFRKKDDFSLLVLVFPELRENWMATEEGNLAKMEIIEYIASIPDAIVFKSAEDEILLLLQDDAQMDVVTYQLQSRFENGWGRNREVTVKSDWLLIPSAWIVNQAEDILPLIRYARQSIVEFSGSNELILDRAMAEKMYQKRKVEQLISDAIRYNWIEVYYQPIYSTEEKLFASAEALVRIRNDVGEVIPPNVFIPVAEENGMILKLGEMVFEKVCQLLHGSRAKEFGIRYIEVNLSVIQCSYEFLAERFIGIMERYQVNPSMINFEITESGSVSARKIMLDNMNKLIEYGVSFSLDDFGTGQSNLNYIVDMPVQVIKFDRTMTTSYFENGKAKYVMDAAMHMIQGMKLEIVSEGIETKEQLETMEDLNINYIQGFYFSKPLPQDAFLAFLQENNK